MISRMRVALCLFVVSWGAAVPSLEARPARPAPPLPAPTGAVVNVSTEPQLQAAVRSLTSNTTIVIAPGTYILTSTLYVRGVTNVGIRGATANADDVVLVGPGMAQPNYGSVPFGIWTGLGVDGITIANLTIRDLYFHPIIFNDGTESPRVYNVHLIDAGEQFIKSNPDGLGGGVDNGVVEYSVIEFTTTAKDDYTKGVDVQTAKNWIIRHNLFRNIVAPQGQIAGPGILAWRGTSNTVVEGNTFVNCARGIMLGADDYYSPSHRGGIIRNNVFFRSGAQPGDVGIILSDSPDTQVLNNTVFVSGTYGTPIEYRYAGTGNVLIANNLLDGAIASRDGGAATLTNNYQGAGPGTFVDPEGGDLHLSPLAVSAIDQGAALANVTDDWDGQSRPQGAGYDIGADEAAATSIPGPGSGASAAFIRTDASTHGTWAGAYGADGAGIAGATNSYPAYAQVAMGSASSWTWSYSTTDTRALQRPGPGDRVAACWYSGGSFTIDINLTDGKPHQVALYSVDWDGWNRSLRVDVLDAATSAVLDTRTLSNFQDGQYLVWSLSGHVTLRVVNAGPQNAVASGVFFDSPGTTSPPATGTTATFTRADAGTRGNWIGAYGRQGYALASDAAVNPAWAQVSIASASTWTWSWSTADGRALQRPGGSGRIAACWYSDTAFTVDVSVLDGASHQVALYALDWDPWGRSQRVDVLDAATGAVLDSRTIAAFDGGQYLVWMVSGHVTFRLTNTGSPNAVLSGVFFD
jgi:Right handed beta helix region